MKTWTYYNRETGVLARCWPTLPDDLDPAGFAPPGHAPIDGQHDPDRVRVDVTTGELVPYQPPAPPADEWHTWAWDADAWTWVSTPTQAALAREARAERDHRLTACDWTQLPDVPAATAALWAPYRQALRDITNQPGFPGAITWPEEPTS